MQVSKAFRHFDRDNSGLITSDEVAAVLKVRFFERIFKNEENTPSSPMCSIGVPSGGIMFVSAMPPQITPDLRAATFTALSVDP